jgi:hypothetical protein
LTTFRLLHGNWGNREVKKEKRERESENKGSDLGRSANRPHNRRLLISQDRHEVWITFATFRPEYINYIRDVAATPNQSPLESQNEFLVMHECGPSNTGLPEDVKRLGLVVLALCYGYSQDSGSGDQGSLGS